MSWIGILAGAILLLLFSASAAVADTQDNVTQEAVAAAAATVTNDVTTQAPPTSDVSVVVIVVISSIVGVAIVAIIIVLIIICVRRRRCRSADIEQMTSEKDTKLMPIISADVTSEPGKVKVNGTDDRDPHVSRLPADPDDVHGWIIPLDQEGAAH